MKECKRFEKLLPGYLHGELYEKDYHALRAHLEQCGSCRAELQAQYEALELANHVMRAVPTPARMTGWRRRPVKTIDLRQNLFEKIWFSPQFKAALATGVMASLFFFLSGIFVVFQVLPMQEPCFEPPPPMERPKMMLKKPKVQVRTSQPKPASRIVAKVKTARVPDIQLSDTVGTGVGLLGGAGPGSENLEQIKIQDMAVFGSTAPSRDYSDSLQVASINSSGSASLDLGFEMPVDGDRSVQTRTAHYGDPFAAEPQSESVASTLPWSGPQEWNSADADSYAYNRVEGQSLYGYAADETSTSMDDLFGGTSVSTTSGRKAGLPMLADKETGSREQLVNDLFGGGFRDQSGVVASVEAAPQPSTIPTQLEAKFVELDADGLEALTDRASGDEAGKKDAKKMAESSTRHLDAVRTEAKAEEINDWSGQGMDVAPPKRERKPAEFNPYVMAEANPFSTFSIDVDTASYGLASQQLLSGSLPDTEAVRTEEFINSFDYDYRPPAGSQTFAVHTELAPSPFRPSMDLLKIGIKGRRIGRDDHRGANLTLVIDSSGSMATPDRLELVQQSLSLLIDQLNPEDRVAIVQFGGEARLVCEHTPVSNKNALLQAIHSLQAGGPTQFDKGLELGYQLATTGYEAGDSNRIIIMSDGVANLGELDPDAILAQVADYRKKGIYLSVLGFGSGSYDDEMLEQLANRGDGTYAYVDTLTEARHLFVDQLAATLHVIASDVKIQVEFNPDRVLRYRQVGYENRQLTKEQFRDDTVDAGEVGSGQSVTALYEVQLRPTGLSRDPISTVYVRYRRADNGVVEEISKQVMEADRTPRFEDTGPRFQLAACVAEFAEHLRRSPYAEGTDIADITNRLQPVLLALDLDGRIQELQQLLSTAAGMEN